MGNINDIKGYAPEMEVTDLDNYQRLATGTAVYPGQGSPLGLIYAALKLNGEAGEFAEHVGKALRDDHLFKGSEYDEFGEVYDHGYVGLTANRRDLLVKEVGDVLWYLAAICTELDINLSDAANANLRKLYDRKARGVLQGSGDRR